MSEESTGPSSSYFSLFIDESFGLSIRPPFLLETAEISILGRVFRGGNLTFLLSATKARNSRLS